MAEAAEILGDHTSAPIALGAIEIRRVGSIAATRTARPHLRAFSRRCAASSESSSNADNRYVSAPRLPRTTWSTRLMTARRIRMWIAEDAMWKNPNPVIHAIPRTIASKSSMGAPLRMVFSTLRLATLTEVSVSGTRVT